MAGEGDPSVEDAVKKFKQAVEDGTLRLPLTDGAMLTPDPASFYSFPVPPSKCIYKNQSVEL